MEFLIIRVSRNPVPATSYTRYGARTIELDSLADLFKFRAEVERATTVSTLILRNDHDGKSDMIVIEIYDDCIE